MLFVWGLHLIVTIGLGGDSYQKQKQFLFLQISAARNRESKRRTWFSDLKGGRETAIDL
jgi:hypothetical protein